MPVAIAPNQPPVKLWTLNPPSSRTPFASQKQIEVYSQTPTDPQPLFLLSPPEDALLNRSRHLDIHAPSSGQAPGPGPIIAAVKLHKFSSAPRILLGDPHAPGADARWTDVNNLAVMRHNEYAVPGYAGLSWKRTHRADLGASATNMGSWKLVRAGNGQDPLAAFALSQHALGRDEVHLTWYAELEKHTELTCFAAVLAIDEARKARATRQSNNNGAFGAGGMAMTMGAGVN